MKIEKKKEFLKESKSRKVFNFCNVLFLGVFAFAVYGIADDVLALGVVLVFAWLAYYYFGTVTTEKIMKRSEEMMSDFSEVISKLALLTNAGMIFREAWEEVAYTGDRALYKEMQVSVDEMKNGYAEVLF